MPIATGLALGLAGLSAAGALGGAALSSSAAGKAADTQSEAAVQAAQIQADQANKALGFQEDVYGQQQANEFPFLLSGESGLANLDYLLGILPPGQGGAPGAATGSAAGSTLPGVNTKPAPIATHANLAYGGLGGNKTSDGALLPNGPSGSVGSFSGYRPPTAPGAPAAGTPSGTANQWPQLPTLNSLVNTKLGAPGSLLTPWNQTFTAPTNITEKNDPGYKARLDLGEQALQNSAAARGGLLTGGTARDVNQFAQDYASNEYGNVYNRTLNTYGTNYNTFEQGQTNTFNRLAAIAGIGQTSAGQLNTAGSTAANNVGNILLNSGTYQGNAIQNAGAARASGYVGGANAWSGPLSNLGNYGLLAALLSQGGGGDPSSLIDLSTFAGSE